MTRDEIFKVWAPREAAWSNWVKPVLFAHLPRELPPVTESPAPDVAWAPPPGERVAIIVDLPGAASVRYGLALAAIGYRPVPLFNAVPPPVVAEGISVVNVAPILAELQHGAERLRGWPLPPDAPPAFLIDADRQATHSAPLPGAFDNRSVVFVTDFPSAARLAVSTITTAVLVREQLAGIGTDLTYALQLWQQGGVRLTAKWLAEPGAPVPLTLPRPSWWAGLRQRLAIFFGARRNAAGEFGQFIPIASGG